MTTEHHERITRAYFEASSDLLNALLAEIKDRSPDAYSRLNTAVRSGAFLRVSLQTSAIGAHDLSFWVVPPSGEPVLLSRLDAETAAEH